MGEGYAPRLHDDLAAMLDKLTAWLAATGQAAGDASGDIPAAVADRPLCDQAELATINGVSQRTIRKMDAAGELPPSTVQRGKRMYQRAEVLRWIAADRPSREEWEARGRK